MRKLALDTNIVIDLFNGNEQTKNAIEENADQICLPSVVCGELLYGAKNSGKVEKNLEKHRAFIQNCEILRHNSEVEEAYSDIRKELKDKGNPIPENDIWIAATCKAHDVKLATKDKHFKDISNLKLLEL